MTNENHTDAFTVDVRTRRAVHNQEQAQTRQKHDPQLEQTKALFRELVKAPVYAKLKGLAYAMTVSYVVPRDINQLIAWGFSSASRGFLDMLFQRVETLGREVPAEERPVIDRVRPSFFSENV